MALESLELDGVELNSLTGSYVLRAVDFTPPRKRYEWATGADASGAALVRDPLFENRTITCDVRVQQAPTRTAAHAALQQLIGKLQEAEQQPDGLPLIWSPSDAPAITFYVLSGEIDGIPVTRNGDDRGYFLNYPVVKLTLTCKPFGYGTQVTTSAVSGSTPFLTLTVPAVPGDVPAEGRLLVTDGASQIRRYLEWGLEQHDYDSATSLRVDTSAMTALSGTSTTKSGSVNTNTIRATLTSAPTGIAATPSLTHVGTYRVKARINFGTTSLSGSMGSLRLTWQDADGPFRSNAWVSPSVTATWAEIDLGTISVSKAQLGAQKWTGRLEGMVLNLPSGTLTATVDIDYLILVPAGEGYGKARAQAPAGTGTATAADTFDDATAGSGLTGRVATVGGTWTAPASFVAANAPAAADHTIVDTSASGFQQATLSTAAATDVTVKSDLLISSAFTRAGVVARFVDASNYLRVLVSPGLPTGNITVEKVVAGTATLIGQSAATLPVNTWMHVTVTVWSSGTVSVTATVDPTGTTVVSLRVADTALATGGTLASGKSGLQASSTSAAARYWDNFATSTPPSEPVVLYSGRTGEIRYDGAVRQDAAGSSYGAMPTYRGGRFYLPPAGDKGRISRILVKAHRNDIETVDATNVTDALTAQVLLVPRYLVVRS